ncbi:MAG: lipopolysaccharide heptosyltransferase II [Vicinamibacteria bacterium]
MSRPSQAVESKETNVSGTSRRSILVYAPSWIGDAVMSLGALRYLRHAYPDSQLTVLAKPGIEDLYRCCDAVDGTMCLDATERGVSGFLRVASRLRESAFDLAVLFPNSFRSAATVWAAGIPHRWGYGHDGRGFLLTKAAPPAHRPFGRHQAYFYIDLLRHLGIETGEPDIRLNLQESMRRNAVTLLEAHGWRSGESLIGIHPGATGSAAKRWMPKRYAEVADRLAASHDARVVILGGVGEEAIAAETKAHLRSASIVLASKTSLAELMGITATLSVLICNDSGPMHVASALGVPTVAVFGPTDERETGPLGRDARVVRQQVECSPCLLKDCPIDHRCMDRVTVENVYQVAVDLLKGKGSRQRAEATLR